MLEIPEIVRDLVEPKRPMIAVLVTLMPDGHPQASPVWFDFDGTYFEVNTARGRQKLRNMERDARVTLLIIDPQDDNHYAEMRGRVVEVTEAGAVEHLARLAKMYTGQDSFTPDNPTWPRVICKIAPDRVRGQ